jgi:hypothetical protein
VAPPDADRGAAREIQARTETLDFTALPARAETRLAGLLLAVPDLVALGVPEWRLPPTTRPPRESPPCPTCRRCWRSS